MPKWPYKAVQYSSAINVYHSPRPCGTTSYNNPGLASQYTRSSPCTRTILNFAFWLVASMQILTISLSKGSVCASYTCPSHLGSTMMVPSRSSGSSSNVVACWPAAYDAPTLPTIEALAGLSGAPKGSHMVAMTRNLEQCWPCLAYSKHPTCSQPQNPTNAPSGHWAWVAFVSTGEVCGLCIPQPLCWSGSSAICCMPEWWPTFHGHALGTFALLHSVFCCKMQLVIAGNPLRMHAATELHQWHDQMHQFLAQKGNQIGVTIRQVQ